MPLLYSAWYLLRDLNPRLVLEKHLSLAKLDEGGWSEKQDSNLRPRAPEARALPDCAILRGQSDVNRTHDPRLPRPVLYLAELHSVE